MKALYTLGGVLFGLFAFAQLLQLLGLIGVGSSIAGIGFTILGVVLSYLCFDKARSLSQPTANANRHDFVGIHDDPAGDDEDEIRRNA